MHRTVCQPSGLLDQSVAAGLCILPPANEYSTLPTDRLFTGQTRDTLDTDNTTADPNNPLRLNRYAYADNNPLKYRDGSGHTTESPPEMTTPTIFINVAPPVDNKPVINVAPPITVGPLIFTGQLNTGTICITVQPKVEPQIAINVQSDQSPTIFKASDYAELRKNFEDAIGRPIKDDHVGHHLIPLELKDLRIVQLGIQAGWKINGEANAMELPNNSKDADEEQLPKHWAGHPDYTADVRQQLGQLADQNPADTDLPHLLDKLTDGLFFQISQQGQTNPGSQLQ